jgi:DNA repair protein RecN (Recombination protein N)
VGTSDVRQVEGRDREVELARMLGGTDGATALAHARDLLGAVAVPLVRARSRQRAKAG